MSTRLSTEELDALVTRLQGAADYRREFGPSEGVAIYVLASDAIEQLRDSDARARRALRDLTAQNEKLSKALHSFAFELEFNERPIEGCYVVDADVCDFMVDAARAVLSENRSSE